MLERLSPTIEDMAGHHIQMANADSKTHPPKHVSLALSVAAANYALNAKRPNDAVEFAERAVNFPFIGQENFQTLNTLANAQDAAQVDPASCAMTPWRSAGSISPAR